VLTHLRQLIAAKQMNMLLISTQEKANMTLPARRIFTRQNGNAARNRLSQGIAPVKPRASKCRPGANNSRLGKRPVDKRGTPRGFVVITANVGVPVVFGDSWIALAWWEDSDADFGKCGGHPGCGVHRWSNLNLDKGQATRTQSSLNLLSASAKPHGCAVSMQRKKLLIRINERIEIRPQFFHDRHRPAVNL